MTNDPRHDAFLNASAKTTIKSTAPVGGISRSGGATLDSFYLSPRRPKSTSSPSLIRSSVTVSPLANSLLRRIDIASLNDCEPSRQKVSKNVIKKDKIMSVGDNQMIISKNTFTKNVQDNVNNNNNDNDKTDKSNEGNTERDISPLQNRLQEITDFESAMPQRKGSCGQREPSLVSPKRNDTSNSENATDYIPARSICVNSSFSSSSSKSFAVDSMEQHYDGIATTNVETTNNDIIKNQQQSPLVSSSKLPTSASPTLPTKGFTTTELRIASVYSPPSYNSDNEQPSFSQIKNQIVQKPPLPILNKQQHKQQNSLQLQKTMGLSYASIHVPPDPSSSSHDSSIKGTKRSKPRSNNLQCEFTSPKPGNNTQQAISLSPSASRLSPSVFISPTPGVLKYASIRSPTNHGPKKRKKSRTSSTPPILVINKRQGSKRPPQHEAESPDILTSPPTPVLSSIAYASRQSIPVPPLSYNMSDTISNEYPLNENHDHNNYNDDNGICYHYESDSHEEYTMGGDSDKVVIPYLNRYCYEEVEEEKKEKEEQLKQQQLCVDNHSIDHNPNNLKQPPIYSNDTQVDIVEVRADSTTSATASLYSTPDTTNNRYYYYHHHHDNEESSLPGQSKGVKIHQYSTKQDGTISQKHETQCQNLFSALSAFEYEDRNNDSKLPAVPSKLPSEASSLPDSVSDEQSLLAGAQKDAVENVFLSRSSSSSSLSSCWQESLHDTDNKKGIVKMNNAKVEYSVTTTRQSLSDFMSIDSKEDNKGRRTRSTSRETIRSRATTSSSKSTKSLSTKSLKSSDTDVSALQLAPAVDNLRDNGSNNNDDENSNDTPEALEQLAPAVSMPGAFHISHPWSSFIARNSHSDEGQYTEESDNNDNIDNSFNNAMEQNQGQNQNNHLEYGDDDDERLEAHECDSWASRSWFSATWALILESTAAVARHGSGTPVVAVAEPGDIEAISANSIGDNMEQDIPICEMIKNRAVLTTLICIILCVAIVIASVAVVASLLIMKSRQVS